MTFSLAVPWQILKHLVKQAVVYVHLVEDDDVAGDDDVGDDDVGDDDVGDDDDGISSKTSSSSSLSMFLF